jgi:glycosyltransferase involved in cell wall biosynthesis
MDRRRRVALVIPALNEEASIGDVVRDFRAQPAVELVLVVDNASRDRTGERARSAGAEVVTESRPGYGAALRAGIESAFGLGLEVVVLAEADGTFEPGDLESLLAALEGRDMVLGSRTDCMSGTLRHGNRAVAWLLSALWWRSSCRLTDVGCTYRALTARGWTALRDGVGADGPEFSPQMICAAFEKHLAVCEIPVRYGTRTSGASKHTGSLRATARTAARMLRTILAQRMASR